MKDFGAKKNFLGFNGPWNLVPKKTRVSRPVGQKKEQKAWAEKVGCYLDDQLT